MSAGSASPVLQAVMQIITEHGPVDGEEIVARLNRGPAEALRDKFGSPVFPTQVRVGKLLRYLQSNGRIRRDCKTRGQSTWVVVPEPEQLKAMQPARRARAPSRLIESSSAGTGALVPPRRINVMVGSYEPKPFTPARPGAMQYAQVPSLHMGHRQAFRSEAGVQ